MNKKEMFYHVLKLFVNLNIKKVHDIELPLKKLNKISPDPQSSCFVKRPACDQKYDLDIIVPVYNIQKDLKACLDSIIHQKTQYHFRIITVDDGSTDNCLEILKEYEDEHFLVIHQENKGLSGARNTALDYVNAKYIMFVDSDDCLPQGAIESLLKTAFDQEADLVEGDYQTMDTEGLVINTCHFHPQTIMQFYGYAWGKVIKWDVFNSLVFPLGYWFEDTIMHMIVYPLCHNHIHISDIVYSYRVNPQGISAKSRNNVKSIDSFYITRKLYDQREKLNLGMNDEIVKYLLQQVRLTFVRTYNLDTQLKQYLFFAWKDFLLKDVHMDTMDTYLLNVRDKDLVKALETNNYVLYKYNCLLT